MGKLKNRKIYSTDYVLLKYWSKLFLMDPSLGSLFRATLLARSLGFLLRDACLRVFPTRKGRYFPYERCSLFYRFLGYNGYNFYVLFISDMVKSSKNEQENSNREIPILRSANIKSIIRNFDSAKYTDQDEDSCTCY
ncbi:hypothetical protein POVCU2_0099700 [Plasmodium ovale curtisi]|uniref:Uncharacterized protein n=1 Tax=Plasmodium ovale curtisi TaxID=864141 RepID=A0A1A8X2V8_PLAOA|nr:hypothetical protein POVCU2_0099700 [Plasmodium ovale curtisi]SBS98506.1 hypothetical protein POVCU1_046640 [Plasmodium ovale curtisi]